MLLSTEYHSSCEIMGQSGHEGLKIVFPRRSEIRAEIKKGSETTMQGWISERYGCKATASTLSVSVETSNKYRMCYLLIPKFHQIQSPNAVPSTETCQLSWEHGPHYDLCTIESKLHQDRIYFFYEKSLMLFLNNLEANAETIHIRSDKNGMIQSIIFLSPSLLKYGDNSICSEKKLERLYVLQSTVDRHPELCLKPLGFDNVLNEPRSNAISVGQLQV
jgi:hypothetical protein